MHDIPHQIANAIAAEAGNTVKYREQLRALAEGDKLDDFLIRLSKGMHYYQSLLLEQRKLLVKHLRIAAQAKRGRKYMNDLKDLDQLLTHYWMQVAKVFALADSIVNGRDTFDFSATQQAEEQAEIALAMALAEVLTKKKKDKKSKKVSTPDKALNPADLALQMFREGMKVEEIAERLQLPAATIESHLTNSVQRGRVMITELLGQKAVDEITATIVEMSDGFALSDLHARLDGKYGVWMLRAVISDLVSRDNLH
jgi:hypothetical protein